MMQLGPKGEKLIKQWEGLGPEWKRSKRIVAYFCPAGKPTIGWGHTRTVKREDVGKKEITMEEANRLFKQDILKAIETVNKVKGTTILTQNQFDALVSLCYNIGETAFRDSTVARLIKAGSLAMVPAAMKLWNKITDPDTKALVVSPGLVNRRNAEVDLWNDSVQPELPQPAPTRPQPGTSLNARILARITAIRTELDELEKLIGPPGI